MSHVTSVKIRKGDEVKIISGNDKAKQGKVLAVFGDEERVVVDGLNMRKRHVRPRKQGQKGEIVSIPAPFAVSRVMMICPKCSKPTRIGYQVSEGRKTRVCRKCGREI